ncbi:MAG: four helix bundle protein [bacterium]|nr:four helix bundle protein [bacterium]
MNETQNSKQYDLEPRTMQFTKQVAKYVNCLPGTISNLEIAKQLFRSAASVGANYIEANEALRRKDFIMRIKISRKGAKESRYWITLSEPHIEQEAVKIQIMQESTELMKIFGSIVEKSK